MTEIGELLWTPSTEQVERARMSAFMQHVRDSGVEVDDYADLWAWSTRDIEAFWSTFWDFMGLDELGGYERVLSSHDMPGAQWFPGARLNFATYLLSRGSDEDVAITSVGEDGAVTALTRAELRDQVRGLALTLRSLGVGPGDVVVGYLPNTAETVVAFLATVSLAAIWSAVGQDYAPSAVVHRFEQLAPKVLVTAPGYRFNGSWHDRSGAAAEIRAGIGSLEHVLTTGGPEWTAATSAPGAFKAVTVPFSHPLWVVFSSGTTGLPKGLVQSHGGVLLLQLKDLALHFDIGRDDRFFWYTSPSWIMWNIQTCALATGAGIVCYDGSPTFPDAGRLWQVTAEAQVSFLGISPGYLQAGQSADLHPARDHDLSRLRAIGATGSPLAAGTQGWAAGVVPGVPVISTSGGTDICGGFVGGATILPVHAGKISARLLGVALDCWDEQGHPVVGEAGEMVITEPLPSMPIHLWKDRGGERYREAYFSMFPGVWRHGDSITLDADGSVVIHGRSDSTLNRNGVRMGSADIYAAVETVPEVHEALVIGAEQADGSYWMPLFVVLADGAELTDELTSRIRDRIRHDVSPRHVPDEVIAVPALPHTRTGKKLEVPVKRLLQGAELSAVANPDAIDDPAALAQFVDIRTLAHPTA